MRAGERLDPPHPVAGEAHADDTLIGCYELSRGWMRVERAMRQGRPLPLPLLVPVLATGGAVVAVVLFVFILMRPA